MHGNQWPGLKIQFLLTMKGMVLVGQLHIHPCFQNAADFKARPAPPGLQHLLTEFIFACSQSRWKKQNPCLCRVQNKSWRGQTPGTRVSACTRRGQQRSSKHHPAPGSFPSPAQNPCWGAAQRTPLAQGSDAGVPTGTPCSQQSPPRAPHCSEQGWLLLPGGCSSG